MSTEVRIVQDGDCPGCGWPETVAVGPSLEEGPRRLECAHRPPCGWSEEVRPR